MGISMHAKHMLIIVRLPGTLLSDFTVLQEYHMMMQMNPSALIIFVIHNLFFFYRRTLVFFVWQLTLTRDSPSTQRKSLNFIKAKKDMKFHHMYLLSQTQHTGACCKVNYFKCCHNWLSQDPSPIKENQSHFYKSQTVNT